MQTTQTMAPGVPADYYESIHRVEQDHWWHTGMRAITAALLGDRLTRPGQALLDAGCGTGGLLRWALDTASPSRACGVDVASSAIELAQQRVPEAELAVAPVSALPFESSTFDIVWTNDVLQHIAEGEVAESLREVVRVLRPDGVLLVRTNGGRRARRERDDWRLYDRASLEATLAEAGLHCLRVTYANMLLSFVGTVRGRAPRAPTTSRHGIAEPDSRLQRAIGRRVLEAEARYLSRPGRTLPHGHTLFAVATRAGG